MIVNSREYNEIQYRKNRKFNVERTRIWRLKNKNKVIKYRKKYRKIKKHIVNAHQAVHRAKKSGLLHKPAKCESCNSVGYIEAHHNDYKKVLEVIWLCRTCHKLKHKTQTKESVRNERPNQNLRSQRQSRTTNKLT